MPLTPDSLTDTDLCPADLALSLPIRIIKHFDTRAAELDIPFHLRTQLMIDYIKQFAVALLETKPPRLETLARTPHGAARRCPLYIGHERLLRRALHVLSKRYGVPPSAVARAAFYAYDTRDPRFQFRLPKERTAPPSRKHLVVVSMRQHLKDAASRYCVSSASDSYRELITSFIRSGKPLPPREVMKETTGYVQVSFMLSDKENADLIKAVARLGADSRADIVRAAFLQAPAVDS